MTQLLRISCPTCGGRLSTEAADDCLTCESCGNEYLIQQRGNNVSLVPAKPKDGIGIAGDGNVIVNVNTTPPVHSIEQQVQMPEKKLIIEKVDCPICGKLVSREDTFRCKRCHQEGICISHQDTKTFLCLECNNELRVERKNTASKWFGVFSLVLGFAAIILTCISWYYFIQYDSQRSYSEYKCELSQDTNLSSESKERYVQDAESACDEARGTYHTSDALLATSAIFGSLSLILGIASLVLRKRLSAWIGVSLSLLAGAVMLGVESAFSYPSCWCG